MQISRCGLDQLADFANIRVQQDPSEFICCLVTFMEAAIKTPGPPPALSHLSSALLSRVPAAQRAKAEAVVTGLQQQHRCPLSDLLRHSVVHTTTCAAGHMAVQHESRLMMRVHLDRDAGECAPWGGEAPETLQEALERGFGPEPLPDCRCDVPGCQHSRTKCEAVCTLPPLLVVQVLRSRFNRATLKMEKVTAELDIPEVLDLAPICDSALAAALCVPQQSKYLLRGMCHHDGSDATGGHYWATCRGGSDGVWRRYDDAEVADAACPAGRDATGYLLFYERL